MIPVRDAFARVMETVPPVRTETVALVDALDRVLASPVVSPRSVPPWDASAMDGYAVRSADTMSTPLRLRLVGEVLAGQAPDRAVGPGEAIAITTGAPVPLGADAVVIVENTDGARDGTVEIRSSVAPGANVRPCGDDVRTRDVVLEPGHRLDPAALGMLASLGLDQVEVARPPRVAILTTGSELVAPGGDLGPGQIFSSNDVTLAALARRAGVREVSVARVADDLDATVAAFEATDADVIWTTGGVSVGSADVVKTALAALGVELDFWKIRMKPGKPVAFGAWHREGRKVVVFGLPGNPVSCMVGFYQFVRPWLLASQGEPRPCLPVVSAVAAQDMPSRPGRARFERVVLSAARGAWRAERTGSQSSGVLTSMVWAHGLMLLAPDNPGPAAGDPIEVQLLDTRFLNAPDPGFAW